MIRGIINATRHAVVRLEVLGPLGKRRDVEAAIDTGFGGALTLPSNVVADLALPWRHLAYGKVASGRVEQFDIYEALVRWDRQLQKILVYRSDVQPLLGM